MNLVDAIIIVILIIGVLDGLRKGALKTVVELIGSILIFFLAWSLKGTLANVLIDKLPSLGANPAFSALTYHVVAFIVLLLLFYLIYNLILRVTNIIEKVFDATVVLGFVSRILGAAFGFIKTYIFLFFALFILSIFNISYLNNSKINNYILEKTPMMAPLVKNAWESVKEVTSTDNTIDNIKMLFENKIITEENMNKLIESYDNITKGEN